MWINVAIILGVVMLLSITALADSIRHRIRNRMERRLISLQEREK